MARILVPADFGVVVLASVTIGTLALFSDLGLSRMLVVRQDLAKSALGTALVLMIAMGALLATAVAVLSPVAASIFDEPRLGSVLMVLSGSLLLGSLTAFYESIMQRELQFVRRFKAGIAQSLAYAVVSVSAALAGAGVWSLVAGQLSSMLVYAGVLLRLAPYRVRPAFDYAAARDAATQGRGFWAQSGLSFLELNGDYAAVGTLGASQLGVYSMTFRLSELPYWAITEPVAKVTFPGFARMRHRGESITGAFLDVLRLVTLVACPLGVLLSATASPFTRTLLGDHWLPMIGPLMVLGLWGTINHYEATLGWLFNSVGRAGLNAAVSAFAVIPLVAGVFLAARLGGLVTVAQVMLVHVAASAGIRAIVAHRCKLVSLAGQWRAVRPAFGGALAAWLTARAAVIITSGLPAASSLAVSLVVGLATYAGVVSMLEPGVLPRTARQLQRVLTS